ncbi:MAG: hypothetical protein ACFCVK_05735 [Acidimicrobiales bacterium]
MPTNVTKPSRSPATEPTRWTVTAIDKGADRTTLRVQAVGRPIDIVVPCRADAGAARRWLNTVRRVDRVELAVGTDDTRAWVSGRRHRLPFRSPIPLSVALGLGDLGVDVIILGGSS